MYANFSVTRADRVTTITLARPAKRNPINEEMLGEFEEILRGLRDDPRTRVVVLTGSGPSFCAGADLSVVRGVTDETERRRRFAAARRRRIRLIARTFTLLETLEQPSIAAVNGPAVGGGWGLALACDFHLSVPGATYWFPEVDLGVPLSTGASARLFSMVGAARAKAIILTCSRHSAEELHSWGMVQRIVEPEQLLAAAGELAAQLLQKSARAVTAAKFTVNTLAAVAAREASTFDADLFVER